MSDPTKKSIVINQSFLSGSGKGIGNVSSSNNKLSKKHRPRLSDDIIKPNKLKKMLLDKINAKRKAENTSSAMAPATNIDLDISKESKLFSSEFKKSLDFLENYVNNKKQSNPNSKNTNNQTNPNNSKTMRRQHGGGSGSGNLTNDILKSLHSNQRQHQQQHQQQQFAPKIPTYNPVPLQQHIVTQPRALSPVSPRIHTAAHAYAPINPGFQKIQLQIPPLTASPREHRGVASGSSSGSIINNHPKINMAIGKSSPENMIYTELPPELQHTMNEVVPMTDTDLYNMLHHRRHHFHLLSYQMMRHTDV